MRAVWRRLARGIRALVNRAAADRDLADEVDHYFAEMIVSLMAEGHGPAEAKRRARLCLGERAHVREEVRSRGWESIVEAAWTDARHAIRRMRRSPGFTGIAVLTLGLGIGASTAIYSAVSPLLLEPLPYPDGHRTVAVWDRADDGTRADVTFGTFREVAARSRTFEALAVRRSWQPALASGRGVPERVEGQRVSADYFRVLGVPPAGRDFAAQDDLPNAARVVIVSDGLRRRRFGDEPVVGRTIVLDGVPYTVIGVMPGGFENVLAPRAEVWTPLRYDPALPADGREWGHHLRMTGRLAEGIGRDEARIELAAIARAPVSEFTRVPWASLDNGLLVEPLRDDVARSARPALTAVIMAALVLLLIACVNVIGLLVARGAERRPELALRAVLGAGRGRLAGQLVTESAILAVCGGLLGIALAAAGTGMLRSLVPSDLPRAAGIRTDAGVLVFAAVITALVGVAVGALPALQATRHAPGSDIRAGTPRRVGGGGRVRGGLVVVQVLLAVVLLANGGLLLRSLERLYAVDPGFRADGLLTMQVEATAPRYDDDAAVQRFFDTALDAVGALPGVESAAFTSQLPLTGDLDAYGVRIEQAPADHPELDSALRYAVSPDLFRTMEIPLHSGRLLDTRDDGRAANVAVISATFARHRFGDVNPVGRRFRLGGDEQPWTTIVGVVGDVKHTSLAVMPEDIAYIPAAQGRFDRARWLVVRTRSDPEAATRAVRAAIRSIDPERAVSRIATMDGRIAASVAERRFTLIAFQAFALCALLLAGVGLYGLLAGGVAERTREIGVRSALGATRPGIVRLVVRQGLVLAGLGAVIGLLAALATTRAIGSFLFGVSPLDPVTWAAVLIVLIGVAACATSVPAWRASRVDPGTALRAD